MAIKSEEKNENAVVSKKMPSFVISRKHNVSKKATSNPDTSIANVSSKKSKRTVVRKNKEKTNTINLEAPEIKEVQEVQNSVSEIQNESSNATIITDTIQEKNEVTISLEAVTKKMNEKINNEKISNKEINDEVINDSSIDNTEIDEKDVKDVSEISNSNIDNINTNSNEIKNLTEEKKSPTVITPNYTVHKSRISRRNLSFNLNKNLDDLVVTNQKEKELDISINQNAPFFYEPSVFQKFSIDVIDADSDKDEEEIVDSQAEVISQEDIQQDELNDEDIQNTSDEVVDEVEKNNENDENDANDEDNQLDIELDNLLTELIKKEIDKELKNSKIEETNNTAVEVADETENGTEVSEETLDDINPTDEISESVENVETFEESEKPLEEIKESVETADEVENNTEVSEEALDDINSTDEIPESVEIDVEIENIEDDETFEDIINDIDDAQLFNDIIDNSDNSEIFDELLKGTEESNISEKEIENNEEVLKEAADTINNSKDVKITESAPFFNSSIPEINSEINKNNASNFSKKSAFSNFSNIFKKFTFDEANLKNTISNKLDPISISQPTLANNQNVLENLENAKKTVKELEVSASPATLIIPTINTDEAQFSSADEASENHTDISEFYNIITPASLDTKPDYDDYEEDYRENQDEPKKENKLSNDVTEKEIAETAETNDSLENIDENIDDVNVDDISINDLELLDNIELNDLETLASTINEDEVDENYVNENPIHDDTYFENSNEDDSYFDNEFSEATDDSIEAENYDFENKKMSNYFSEDDEFSIEDYFGLKDIKDETTIEEESEEITELEDIEEDTDAIEFDNNDETTEAEDQEENSKTDMSAFSKLIENFTQTISTLSERIADLEGNKKSNKKTSNDLEDEIEESDIEEETIDNEDDEENVEAISPTEIIDGEAEINDDDNTEIIDDNDNNTNIFEDVSLDDISLEDIDDISLEDIENADNSNVEISDNQSSNNQNEDAIEFDLPLNDNGITDEPNLFDNISVDDINLDDLSLEDIENFENNQSEDKKLDDAKAAKDILAKTFSAENSNINDKMKSELLSELESNPTIDKALLENSDDNLSDNAVTSDLYKIIDTLAETITQLESSPDMEDKVDQIDSSEILNVPTELTGEGKSINILINKDDIFSISILNETYEIVADFDGISVLSENIHISTPKKNFFVKIGEKYIEIHNKTDNFLVYTNFEDIEFANAINNVAFAKKNNKIELNIKEAFKIASTKNKVELSMLNTSVADIVNSNSDNSENIDESSICDNRTLLISEETQKVYLPYTIEEVMKKLHDSNEYQTVEEVIENEYTVPLATFKMPIISRFKEAYRFMRVKEKSSVYAAVDLALELMFTSNLNPAVIRAAKNLKELNVYLDCLYENEVDKFDCFKIIYKVLPKIK